MLNQAAHLTAATPSGTGMMEVFKTRFGDITVDTNKSFLFPRGLLGMPDKRAFVLSQFPNAKMEQFMLLQSVDEKNLSFITLPLEGSNAIITPGDLKMACRDLQIEEKNLAMLLIVSVHRGLSDVKLSVNARAPLIIDVERRVGAQYVFQQESYKVQHML
jgi:flagellar assembly factor FliW